MAVTCDVINESPCVAECHMSITVYNHSFFRSRSDDALFGLLVAFLHTARFCSFYSLVLKSSYDQRCSSYRRARLRNNLSAEVKKSTPSKLITKSANNFFGDSIFAYFSCFLLFYVIFILLGL